MIRINDLFWTFQGEGSNAGRRALFVRLPFCNLKCIWCDTEFNTFKKMEEQEFKDYAHSELGRFAVITGGEPSINKDLSIVIKWLKDLKFEIAIESNGTYPINPLIDFITISPKRDADYLIHVRNKNKIDDLKIVVDENFDWSILNSFDHLIGKKTKFWLSPEYGRMTESVKEIELFIQTNPRWRLNLQQHKWIGIK